MNPIKLAIASIAAEYTAKLIEQFFAHPGDDYTLLEPQESAEDALIQCLDFFFMYQMLQSKIKVGAPSEEIQLAHKMLEASYPQFHYRENHGADALDSCFRKMRGVEQRLGKQLTLENFIMVAFDYTKRIENSLD